MYTLSLSLSLSLSSRAGVITHFFLLSYARAKRTVTPVNKGLLGVSFVRFFVSVCEQDKRQNKDVLSINFTTKDTYNSLVIVCFLSLISRAGSGNTLSACRRGENGRLRNLYNEFIRMYVIKDVQQSHIESR